MTRKPVQAGPRFSRRQFVIGTGVAGAGLLAGCTQNSDGGDGDGDTTDGTTGGSGSLSGEVVVKGSSTVYPVSLAMAEEFQQAHGSVNVSVDSTGTGGGFQNHFCPGNADINDASRRIKDSETDLCNENGIDPIEFRVASDALTVAVNNEADWVDCLSYDQLAQIWRADGAETWQDLDSSWPDKELKLYGPASTSGTFDWFVANVLGEDARMRSDYEATEDDNRIIQGIQDSEAALGYFGYAYYKENADRVKAVEIKEAADDECVAPSLENAKSGDYPMARPLFIYASEASLAEEQVYEFVEFYLTQAETDIVKEIGYVPSSAEQRDANLEKLEGAVESA